MQAQAHKAQRRRCSSHGYFKQHNYKGAASRFEEAAKWNPGPQTPFSGSARPKRAKPQGSGPAMVREIAHKWNRTEETPTPRRKS